MEVEINVDLAILNARSPLRALADVNLRLSDLEVTVRRCAVFEKPGAPPWVSLPRLSLEKNRKRRYVPLLELPRDLKQRVFDAVLAEYRRKAGAR